MKAAKETKVLAAIRKADPEKIRVNFFISVAAKKALASWCKKNGVSESSAIEAMVRDTIPAQYFGEEK